MKNKRDYYEVLSVDRKASNDEIKRAYRQLAIQYHPDRNPDVPDAEERFKEATEAYKALSDEEQRRVYDRYGHEGLRNSGFQEVDDIFQFSDVFGSVLGDLFGFASGASRARRPARGANIKKKVTLSFRDAYRGVERMIEINQRVECVHCSGTGAHAGQVSTCPDCRGTGNVTARQAFLTFSATCARCGGIGQLAARRCDPCSGQGTVSSTSSAEVSIPGGVDSGDTMRLPGDGGPGLHGGPPGDLYLVFEVEPDPRFRRDRSALHMDIPISFVQAALGDKVRVETMDGEQMVTVESGSQPGSTITLRGKGMPDPNSGRRGSLTLHVRVSIPTRLSRQQKRALNEIKDLFTD